MLLFRRVRNSVRLHLQFTCLVCTSEMSYVTNTVMAGHGVLGRPLHSAIPKPRLKLPVFSDTPLLPLRVAGRIGTREFYPDW